MGLFFLFQKAVDSKSLDENREYDDRIGGRDDKIFGGNIVG